MNFSIAEILFVLASVAVVFATFLISANLDQPQSSQALLSVCAGLLFWTLSMRAISLCMQSFAEMLNSQQEETGAKWRLRLLAGISLKMTCLLFLTVLLLKVPSFNPRFFVYSTLAYIFIGSFFLVAHHLVFNKNK